MHVSSGTCMHVRLCVCVCVCHTHTHRLCSQPSDLRPENIYGEEVKDYLS